MEDVFICGIAITGMVLGYKLLSELIAAISGRPKKMGRRKRHQPPPPPVETITRETNDELIARARAMQRRIETLEAIIASEREKGASHEHA